MTGKRGILWRIGVANKDTADLAFRPQSWEGFKQLGFVVIGHSDASKNWPYLHPGPADRWASKRSCTYDVAFVLKSVPKSGECQLVLDLTDIHREDPPKLQVTINGKPFIRQLPRGKANEKMWDKEVGSHGTRGKPTKSLTGRNYRLEIPFSAKLLKKNLNEIAITSISGSFMLYDSVTLKTPKEVELNNSPEMLTVIRTVTAEPFVLRKTSGLYQPIKVITFHIGQKVPAKITVTDFKQVEFEMKPGENVTDVFIKQMETEKEVEVSVEVAGKSIGKRRLLLKPVRKWEIYIIHQTHVDIGYTEYQPIIEKKDWGYLTQAVELAHKTADWPEGSQFKWNPEITWAVESYLEQASEKECNEFIKAVKKGWIGLDALYMSELTGLCSDEELFHLTKGARRLAKKYGLKIDSVMIGDVPGCTWGMAEALAKSGVKYFNMGINYWPYRRSIKYGVDWGGTSLKKWGDMPFYWVSQSGKEKILFWMSGRGYCWFHRVPLNAEVLGTELNRLEEIEYPYEITHLRHTIGGDNGPPMPQLSEIVRDWNKKYAWPKLIIATNSEMFNKFERRYSDRIPSVSGDFTPYWERIVSCAALEETKNRSCAERLLQAQALWAMLGFPNFPEEDFASAWRGLITYNEHTWGCLVSLPEKKRRRMWGWKVGYLNEADVLSRKFLKQALSKHEVDVNQTTAVDIFNTCSWPRTDLVILTKDQSRVGEIIKDSTSKTIPSQRLKSGELAFVAKDIPAFGTKRYTINTGKAASKGQAKVVANTLSNNSIYIAVDKNTGAIKTFKWLKGDTDFASEQKNLNACTYSLQNRRTRKLINKKQIKTVKITIEEAGPLVASLLIESGQPGNHRLTRRLRLVDDLEQLEIANTIGVEEINKNGSEIVQFSFEFAIDESNTRFDIPWAIIRKSIDQLPGACDSVTLARWFDVSNQDFGVTCAVIDAPMITFESDKDKSQIINSIATHGYGADHYKDPYDVPLRFRYAFRPHKFFNPADAVKFGIEKSRPLIVAGVDSKTPLVSPLLELKPAGVIATLLKPSADNEALIVRLYNVSGRPERVIFTQPSAKIETIWLSNLDEDEVSRISSPIDMAAHEVITLRLSISNK